MPPKPALELAQKLQNRQLLQGRLAAAKWIALSEPEVAREVRELESDPLFSELLYGGARVLRRKRWPAAGLHSGFYEIKEDLAAGRGSADISDILEKKDDLVALIRRIGRDAFEKYFLYGEEGKPLAQVCRELGLSEAEGKRILDLVLEVGARSEFFTPPTAAETAGKGYHCIARIEKDPRDPENLYFLFTAPQWARGRYEVLYDRLESWKKERKLAADERRRLRRMLKRIELLNMRQDTLFQILSRATTAQSAYLRTRVESRRRPLSLRELARRIGVAPSTVSRAVGTRSVELPWGEEAPLKSLLSGQRVVVMSILNAWLEAGEVRPGVTDDELMRRLAREHGISVSRRTVNECRRKLQKDEG